MKKYRLKTTVECVSGLGGDMVARVHKVQLRGIFGLWINIKTFYDPWEPDFAKREAQELLEKLNE